MLQVRVEMFSGNVQLRSSRVEVRRMSILKYESGKYILSAIWAGGGIALLSGVAVAQTTGINAEAQAQAASVRQDTPTVEPGAVDALRRMSGYLRTVPTFQLKAITQRDEVDQKGQLVTLSGETTYKVKAPDAFNIMVVDTTKKRDFVYDGKSVTVYDPKSGFYTHFNAPPTIPKTLDMAEAKYNVSIPLRDLFHWDQNESKVEALTSAHFVGEATVNGQQTNQYAFRQPGVDWQVWIAKGDRPAPLRIEIVGRDDPARPKYQADLIWNTAPQFSPDTFVFTPPAGAKPIPITNNP
jgi:hypothetical protein